MSSFKIKLRTSEADKCRKCKGSGVAWYSHGHHKLRNETIAQSIGPHDFQGKRVETCAKCGGHGGRYGSE